MMYLLDLSGPDEAGKSNVKRFGGRFTTIDDAEAHGRLAARTGRFVFKPTILWVRDETNEVVRKTTI